MYGIKNNAHDTTCCEKLIINENQWKFVAKMNMQRSSFPVVSCGNNIWALGGYNVKDGVLNTTEYYDDIDDKWTLSTRMREKRKDHSAVAFRESIYVIGGLNFKSKILVTAEVLDTTTKQFTSIMDMQVSRYDFAAAISEHKLYCFGGNNEYDTTVESFDLYTREWSEEEAMPDYSLPGYSAITIYDD